MERDDVFNCVYVRITNDKKCLDIRAIKTFSIILSKNAEPKTQPTTRHGVECKALNKTPVEARPTVEGYQK